MTDWISKLTWGLYLPVDCRSVQSAGARCIVHNTKVAMLAWKLKCSLSGDRWDFQVNRGSGVFSYYGQYRKPRVRERMRVSMVTRLCARAERSVLFRIEKSPCWLGNPNEPLAVTDWISKFCIVQARNVAMLTWKSKCALSGDRLNFQVDMSSCVCSRLWAMQQALRARTRAGDHGVPPVCARRAFCIVQNRRVAMLAWKPK